MLNFHTSHNILLASGSNIRRQILEKAGLPFQVVLSSFDEESAKQDLATLPPTEKALALATGKACAVSEMHTDALVIGGDQLCVLEDGTILDKPLTMARAFSQLKSMQNKRHTQHCAAVLAKGGEVIWSTVELAHIQMRPLSDEDIHTYLALEKPLQACGSYQLEGSAKHLFARLEGSDDAVLGLPLVALLAALYQKGFLSWKH